MMDPPFRMRLPILWKAGSERLHALIEQFKVGARLYDEGCEDEDNDVQWKGIVGASRAIRELDTCDPDARIALIPLLDDPHPGVRVYAAGYLLKLIPQRALVVLRDIQDRSLTRTHMTAFRTLWAYEHGELDL